MARRVTPSQLRSMIRRAEAKQKKVISDYNRAVRDYNRKLKRAVDNYNRAARAYNTNARANRRRLESELSRLKTTSPPRATSIRSSTQVLCRSFTRVESRVSSAPPTDWEARFLDLSAREAANSVAAVNALEGKADEEEARAASLNDTAIGDELRRFSPDLDQRWRGALFALDPRNPDAARHFCVSAREVFTQFLEHGAPDQAVLGKFPECDRAPDGRPTRRYRVRFLLAQQRMAVTDFEDFVAQDVDDILELFRVFNAGTHGSAGKYTPQQLAAIKRRVEDGLLFLASLIN